MRIPLLLYVLAMSTSCTGLGPVLGGGPVMHPSEIARLDTADARDAAEAAQARFENTRWAHLPWTWHSRSGSSCDEIVGRFCLWFDAGGSSWSPPEEPARVADARDTLIGTLAAASSAHSDDPWIVGQHVRYLLEAGRFDEAERVAEECASEPWWCLALEGYALHARAEFARAEVLFDDALALMPADERDRWTDLSVLLGPTARREYRRLDPAARMDMERRFWQLADPFVSVPGNERRSEHFTRHVLARLAEDARSPERVSWGDDLRELLLRYGAAASWQRVRPSSMRMAPPSVVSHSARGGREMLPPWELVRDATSIPSDAWTLETEHPRTEYAPAYSVAFHALEQQVALFRRGDSARVVAAWRVPSDSFPGMADVEAALVLSAGVDDTPVISSRTTSGRRGAITATTIARPLVMSLELLARAERQAARARFGVRPPWSENATVAISDLLLIEPRDPLPGSLDEAMPLARSSARLHPDERIGVFWEVYSADEAPRQTFVTLSLTRGEVGWARRLAERIGLADEFDGLKLQWEERVGSRVTPRAVVLDFERLEPGSYTLELLVAPVGRPSATVTRAIEIRR